MECQNFILKKMFISLFIFFFFLPRFKSNRLKQNWYLKCDLSHTSRSRQEWILGK